MYKLLSLRLLVWLLDLCYQLPLISTDRCFALADRVVQLIVHHPDSIVQRRLLRYASIPSRDWLELEMSYDY